MGYLYRAPLLYGGQTIPMAVTTAIGFIFLGVGLVAAAGPYRMPVRLLVGHSSHAKLLRVFLPLSILIVLSQDILHRFVFVSYHINSVLFSILSLVFFVVITGVIVMVMAGVLGRALDASEDKRERAEDKIKQQNELLTNIISNIPNSVFWKNLELEYLGCNENFAQDAGLKIIADVVGKTDYDLAWNREEADFHRKCDREVISNGTPITNIEEPQLRADGNQVTLLTSKVPLRDTDGKITGILGVYTDITGRKKAEKERENLAKFPSENPNPVLRITKDGEVLYSNQAGELLLSKWGSDIGKTVPEKWRKLITEALAFEKGKEEEEEVKDKIFLLTIAPVKEAGYVNLYASDITQRKKAKEEKELLQSQLRQTQKMEAIGTLAGGIAHDFNNILCALIGYADLAKDDIPEGTAAHQNQEQVINAANRAAELVKQILTFSRKDETNLHPVNITAIVEEALKMLRSSIPTTIEIHHDINCNSAIMTDETQIHQVLLNLCTNAAHAMTESGGILKVSLTDVNICSDIMTIDGNLRRGSYVKLSVKDTGSGMSREVQERIFEPFYTTKEVGKGTGLGLSVIHGIVENHDGALTVDSKLGEGTAFEIFFPCVEDREMIETGDSKLALGQGEQILFVDDEEALVDVATQTLGRLGYNVVGKTDSIEALEAFKAEPDRFDIVITDQTMPNMKGMQLAEELMNIRPDIPIILCSGYSESINPEGVKAVGIKEFLMKPVDKQEISQVIRQVLEKKQVAV